MALSSSGRGNFLKGFKTVLKVSVFVLLTVFALFYVLKDNSLDTLKRLFGIELLPFFVCLCVVFMMVFLDGVILTWFARIYRKGYRFSDGLFCSLIGSCFSCINKAGGHLMQAIALTKQKVESYHAASVITMSFLMYQLTLTAYSLVFVVLGYPYMRDVPLDLLNGMPIFYVSLLGLFVDLIFLLLILFAALSKRFHRLLIETGLLFMRVFRFKGNYEAKKKEWVMKMTTYRIEFRRLFQHKGLVLIIFFIGMLRQVATDSIPFFTLWCMDLDVKAIGYFPLLCASSYLNLITTFIPTGAPEVAYQSIFGYLAKDMLGQDLDMSLISSGDLLWRFLTFYLPISVGGIAYLFDKFPKRKSEKGMESLTMYDLEVVNYQDTIMVKKDGSTLVNEKILTPMDIERSMKKIKRHFSKLKKKKDDYYDNPLPLDTQKKRLEEFMKEVKRLDEENQADALEIKTACKEEVMILDKKKRQRLVKKKAKQLRAFKRKSEKEARKLEKLQPVKTHVTYDERYGLNLGESGFIVEQSYVTSDPDEDKECDPEKNKKEESE